MAPIISINHIGKSYRLGMKDAAPTSFREAVTEFAKAPFKRLRNLREPGTEADTFWALKDISFEVKRGEVVGLIGRNGAGKSTLLKILSRITEPTEGEIRMRGRVASLLEVGTGFHAELTGRENIYLNGSILGMKKSEIDRKFDEIVAFSEVEKFLDTPVKRYSSGMYVRLAFAVAAHLEPEILIVDEVLAVGDAEFQKKCLGKMQEVAQGHGRTVLFVSHNMAAVQKLCTRGVLLRKGRMVMDGKTDDVVKEYLSYLSSGSETAFTDNPERSGSGAMRLTGGRILDENGQPARSLVAGRPATIELDYENVTGVRRADIFMTILNHLGTPVTNFNLGLEDSGDVEVSARGTFRCHIPRLPFPLGEYRVAAGLNVAMVTADLIPNALVFEVESSTFFPSHKTPTAMYCAAMVDHTWSHETALQSNQATAEVTANG
jgi:lipopolysaccharide transport system ATP-binding protein